MSSLDFADSLFKTFPSGYFLVSISGESGLGKTTLALQLVGSILRSGDSFSGQCVWVQASEVFPLHRLASLYSQQQLALAYLKKHIYVIPTTGPFSTYKAQQEVLESFSNCIFPPEIKVIVIDNISHHLRYRLMQQEDMSIRSRVVDQFYTEQLYPLMMRCLREEIFLVLIHEVSYSVKEGSTRLFFAHLYEKLDMISIALSKAVATEQRVIVVKHPSSDSEVSNVYELTSQGVVIL
jgi:RecA/RadA recombinase